MQYLQNSVVLRMGCSNNSNHDNVLSKHLAAEMQKDPHHSNQVAVVLQKHRVTMTHCRIHHHEIVHIH